MRNLIGNSFQPTKLNRKQQASCNAVCPLEIDVATATLLAKTGDNTEARRRLMRNNPMPQTLSHLCGAPCSSACGESLSCRSPLVTNYIETTAPAQSEIDGGLGGPLGTRTHLSAEILAGTPKTKKPRVAIIGSSPMALGAGFFLTRADCHATIFDSQRKTGGWLLNSVASMRLPEESLRSDLRRMKNAGMEFRLADDETLRGLINNYRESGFDALLIVPPFFDAKRNEILTSMRCAGLLDLGAFGRTTARPGASVPDHIAIMGCGSEALAAGTATAKTSAGQVTVVLHDSETHHCGIPHTELDEARAAGVKTIFADCRKVIVRKNIGAGRFALSGGGMNVSLLTDIIVLDASLRPTDETSEETIGFTFARHTQMTLDNASMLTEKPGVFCAEPPLPANVSVAGELARGRDTAAKILRHLNNADLDEMLRAPEALINLSNGDKPQCAECLQQLVTSTKTCSGCLECVDACPTGALYAAFEDGSPLSYPRPEGPDAPKPRPMLDADLCIKCGACTSACPQGSLEICALGWKMRPAATEDPAFTTPTPDGKQDIAATI